MPAWLMVILIAALPVIELRGALPAAVAVYHFRPLAALTLSVVGCLLPFPFIYYFFTAVLKKVQEVSPPVHAWLEKHIHSLKHRHAERFDRFGALALFLISAMPVPGMGAWSAAVLAVLFDIRFSYAFPALAAGTVVAGVLVLGATVGIGKILG